MVSDGRRLSSLTPWEAYGYVEKLCGRSLFRRWQRRLCVVHDGVFYVCNDGRVSRPYPPSTAPNIELRLQRRTDSELLRRCIFRIRAMDGHWVTIRVTGHMEIKYWMQHLLTAIDQNNNTICDTNPRSNRDREEQHDQCPNEQNKKSHKLIPHHRVVANLPDPPKYERVTTVTHGIDSYNCDPYHDCVTSTDPPSCNIMTAVGCETTDSDSSLSSKEPKLLERVTKSLSVPSSSTTDKRQRQGGLPVRPQPKEPKPTVSLPRVNSFLRELTSVVSVRRQKVDGTESSGTKSDAKTADDSSSASTTAAASYSEDGVDRINRFDKFAFMEQLSKTLRRQRAPEPTEGGERNADSDQEPVVCEQRSETCLSERTEPLIRATKEGPNGHKHQDERVTETTQNQQLPPPLPSSPPPKLEPFRDPPSTVDPSVLAFRKHWNSFDTRHVACTLCKTHQHMQLQNCQN